ncbi:SDR family oxidoreductase [Hirschia litorea]|uniref:SDR family oxidoreductase n=1 Tax=Hirschia litorea TaxID=1199156 RepID=A0ABW2IGX2_9PROT
MNVLVAGATGNTGQRLVRELVSRGHNPIALVRESSDTSSLPANVQLRQGDLTDLSDNVCDGCDSVVFAAGSGGNTSAEMTDKVDRDGAKRLTDIAAKSDVKRFVMLSSVGAEFPPKEGQMARYLQAKHEADEHLMQSGLEHAILRPVSLTDDDGVRNMVFGQAVDPKAKAARGDVAAVLARAVDEDQWVGAPIVMQSHL